ncbi:MAG: CPBP family intramembrane metalloprotease [Chromatiaceae bacterium]|nr:MAG: CPBP family intramembrane metalloprotease [Chromatiaceae bacterium]
MRITALFFAYLLICLLLAALLTYPLLAAGWFELPPRRVMGRLAQGFMLLGFWPFLCLTGLANRTALGFDLHRPAFLRRVAGGWLLGLAMLGPVLALLVALGVRVPVLWGPTLAARLLAAAATALLAGLLIALLEETFFRGALYRALRRRGGARAAACWSALLYALVHFLKPHDLPPGTVLDWGSTCWLVQGVFTGLWRWEHLDSLSSLFAAGVLLALLRERCGHIAWGIGLHAGWVFVIQVGRRATWADPQAPLAGLTGSYDGIIGWLAAAWLLLLLWPWWRWARGRTDPVPDPPPT